jgi:sec-independent protein translocase protein TatA
MIGPVQLGILGLIVVLLFGTKKLPELGSGLGKAISNFKTSYREGSEIDVTPKVTQGQDSTKDDGPSAAK